MDTSRRAPYVPSGKPLSFEDRLINIEAQQLAMGSSMLRSMSSVHKSQTDTEEHLRWCSREIAQLQSTVRVFALLNVMLVLLLIIFVLHELV
jgi:hypothetical protein